MPPPLASNVLRDHINRIYEQGVGFQEWQNLPEIPTAAEILGPVDNSHTRDTNYNKLSEDLQERFLPQNIIDRPWGSVGDYIGAHYQLLREDAIAPLRHAVSTYKSRPSMNDSRDLSIYTHVHIVGMTFSSLGPAPRIEFSYERAGKRIHWQQSKRLKQGTIVALTPAHDKFKTICKVAVVAARPLQGLEQNPPQIDIFWGDPAEADFNPLQEFIMVEAKSGYFEASRHMLVALQKLMTEKFPLSDHLAHLNKSVGVPDFVQQQPLTNLNILKPNKGTGFESLEKSYDLPERDISAGENSLYSVDILDSWPRIKGTTLDDSQLAALRGILTKKLAIVQGPPGTGKTFVSISALSVMLNNLRPSDPPIIVAAQTNHALDQLLNLIAPIEPNFLRLGGRTSEDNFVVRERTLYEVRAKSHSGGRAFQGNYRNAKDRLDSSSLDIQLDIQKALTKGDSEARILLEWKIITQGHFDSLYDDDWVTAHDPELPLGVIALWLGRDQLATPSMCPSINLGFGYKEDMEFEALEEGEVEAGKKDDDDIDMLNGKWFPFRELYTGVASYRRSDKKLQDLLDSNSNLWGISPAIRGEVYCYLKRQLTAKIVQVFRGHVVDYHQHARHVKIARWEADVALIQRAGVKLIGCTTTGLSKYRGLLASLQPRTMLIEEAAETLEGTILAGIFESLQQLILVGDHQQLRAHCNVEDLDVAPYNLAVSMFERLVNNGIEYTMLNTQRRMISDIRELLNPFYPNLQDHYSVLDRVNNRKPVPGMGGRDTYFFHHQWPESRDNFLSRFNVYEADIITAFFTYLVYNGVEPSQITILTFYNGQRKTLLQKLHRQPELAQYGTKFNVFTVDSYQGEENDIILLSLVRSNIHHNIGFLENKNRAVVSLSRARRGMYIFGNSFSLLAANAQSFNLWSVITHRLLVQKRLNRSSGLPVVCENHHTEIVIFEPSDLEELAGGCRLNCNGKLPCGHSCPYLCHPFLHEDVICKESCHTILSCGHECTKRCGDICRCACSIESPLNIMNGPLRDEEAWQLPLDDVLGDSPTTSRSVIQKTTRGVPKTPGISAPNFIHSSSRKWREWDAAKSDEAVRSALADAKLTTFGAGKIIPFIERTHHEVVLINGTRVGVAKDSAAKYRHSIPICPLPRTRRPAEKLTDVADLSAGKKTAANQQPKTRTGFSYTGSTAISTIVPIRLGIPRVSLLKSTPTNSSMTLIPNPSGLPDQALSTPQNTIPTSHYLGASSEKSFQISSSHSVFPNFANNMIDDDEDLISFD